jgi:hypothetical protein
MTINKDNIFIVTGTIVNKPEIKNNIDGSKRVTLKIKPNDSNDIIILTGLISKNLKSLGPYQYMKENQIIQALCHFKIKPLAYGNTLINQIDYIQFNSVINTDKDIIRQVLSDLINTEKESDTKPKTNSLEKQDTQELLQILYQDAF